MKCKAVVIDDESFTRILVSRILELTRDEIEIIEHDDPQEALEWIKKNQADIVIVDQIMPKMRGIELVRKIRAIRNYELVPIVMITNSNDKTVRYEALECGVSDFMLKPIDIPECKSRISNLLNFRIKYLEQINQANQAKVV